jgi:hypothetical protein
MLRLEVSYKLTEVSEMFIVSVWLGMIEAVSTCETSIGSYWTALRNVPEHTDLLTYNA